MKLAHGLMFLGLGLSGARTVSAALIHDPDLDLVTPIPGNMATPGLLSLRPQETYTHSVNVVGSAYNKVIGFSFAGVATNPDGHAG